MTVEFPPTPGVVRDQPPPEPKGGGSAGRRWRDDELVDVYQYHDEQGALLYEVLRYERWEDGERLAKGFRQRRKPRLNEMGHPKLRGGWMWTLTFFREANDADPPDAGDADQYGRRWIEDGSVRRVWWDLPGLLASTGTVFVVEGEKDVLAFRSFGLPPKSGFATCISGGASAWSPAYAKELAGRNVVFIRDADPAGEGFEREFVRDVLPAAASLRTLALPGAKDLAEWVEKGGTLKQLAALVKGTPLVEPPGPEPEPEPPPAEDPPPLPPAVVEHAPEDRNGHAPEWPEPGSKDDPLRSLVNTLMGRGPPEARLKAAKQRAIALTPQVIPPEPKPPMLRWMDAVPPEPASVKFIRAGAMTGMPDVDDMLAGIRAGWYVVSGPSGYGKSTLVNQWVMGTILSGVIEEFTDEEGNRRTEEQPMRWLVLPVEESPEAWAMMILARLAEIDGWRLATLHLDQLTEFERAKVAKAWADYRLVVSRIAFPADEFYSISVDQAREMIDEFAETMKGMPGRWGVVIDPVHALTGAAGEKEYERIERAKDMVMEARKRHDVPIITNVHRSKDGTDKGSNSFVYSAEIRIVVEEGKECAEVNCGQDPAEMPEPRLDVLIAKNRSGATGRAGVKFQKKYRRFLSLAKASHGYGFEENVR